MILENMKEVLMAGQFDRARLMVIYYMYDMSVSVLLLLIRFVSLLSQVGVKCINSCEKKFN